MKNDALLKQHSSFKKNCVAIAALASIVAANLAQAHVTESKDKEKCCGVSLAGQNDCGNLAGTHSCAGQAMVDNDIGEWRLVPTGTCKKLGGYSTEEAMEMFKKMQAKKD